MPLVRTRLLLVSQLVVAVAVAAAAAAAEERGGEERDGEKTTGRRSRGRGRINKHQARQRHENGPDEQEEGQARRDYEARSALRQHVILSLLLLLLLLHTKIALFLHSAAAVTTEATHAMTFDLFRRDDLLKLSSVAKARGACGPAGRGESE